MAKVTWKEGTMLAPVPPALITCGTMEHPNVMTAAWTGIVCTNPPLTYISVRPSRYSHQLIKESGEFVINIPTVALAKAVDWCGVKSGRQVDKFAKMGLTALPCKEVQTPQIEQAPISLECKVLKVENFGSHDMFLAQIVAVDVDDAYIGKQNELHLEKAGLLAYAHGFYYALGRQLGHFGWSVEKKSTKRKRSALKLQNAENKNVKTKSRSVWKKKSSTSK